MPEPIPAAEAPAKSAGCTGCLLAGVLVGLVLLLIGISICGNGLHASH